MLIDDVEAKKHKRYRISQEKGFEALLIQRDDITVIKKSASQLVVECYHA